MARLRLALLATSLLAAPSAAVELGEGHEVTLGIEAGYLHMSGHPSWTEGFVGKLRYENDGLVLSRGFADYRGRLGDTLNARVVLEAYDDNVGNAIDFTQAYLEWRPVPSSATRYRLKVGMFYPRISLENTDRGWSARYTLSSSAINTWVAEELRSTGAELTISRRVANQHQLSLNVSAFVGNDPAGALLAWKGWSVHDRQTRPSDNLPLPPLPLLEPGEMFEAQAPYVDVFREVDDDVGYYANVEWQMGNRLLVRAMHYDNRADPSILENGQYGWETIFDHVAVKATLPGDIGLFAQWMDGSTVMGPWLGEWHPVDVEYQAEYLMLTRAFDKHRLTARYDHFVVTQNDRTREDNNPENGHAWTLAYQYEFSDKARLAVEWLSIKTHHCGWVYYGIPPTATERQTQVAFRLRF